MKKAPTLTKTTNTVSKAPVTKTVPKTITKTTAPVTKTTAPVTKTTNTTQNKTATNSKATIGTKPSANQNAKKEETKKEEPKVAQVKPLEFQEIPLAKFMDIIQDSKQKDLTPVFFDPEGNAFTFLKYKGNLIDLEEFELKVATSKLTQEEAVDRARAKIVQGIKGDTNAFFMSGKIVNLSEYFKGQAWYDSKKFWKLSDFSKEEYYKSIIKPEEDKDGFGNQGGLYIKPECRNVVVVKLDKENKDLEDVLKDLGLPRESVEFYKIKE